VIVELEGGVEGFIPTSKLTTDNIRNPSEAFKSALRRRPQAFSMPGVFALGNSPPDSEGPCVRRAYLFKSQIELRSGTSFPRA
jgi:hypothetical protein